MINHEADIGLHDSSITSSIQFTGPAPASMAEHYGRNLVEKTNAAVIAAAEPARILNVEPSTELGPIVVP